MEYGIKINQKYLGIPVYAGRQEELLEIFCGEEKLFEFQVPVNQKETDGKCDYYSYLNVEKYRGHELALRGDFSEP